MQHLMQEVVPERKDLGLSVQFGIELDRDWDGYGLVSLKLFERSYDRSVSSPQAPIVEGVLTIDHGLEALVLKGPYTRNEVLDRVKAEVRSHPEWTERELAAALRRGGALYPSDEKDAFTRHLQAARFARVFGPVKRVEVNFIALRGPDFRDEHGPWLLWHVKLETEGHNGRLEHRTLLFEPVRGRFVAFTRAETDLP
jgi:hypothetical protein